MNVLILSDFSEVAINATHYAMDLLQEEQVNFTLANIFVPNPEESLDELEARRKATRIRLEERVEALQKRAADRPHKVNGHYSEENLINATRAYMNRNRVDLLVMGAVGKKMRHSTILGDHTFETICKIKCNILAVPEDVQFHGVKNMLMPIDYTISLSGKNLKFLNTEDFFKKTRLSVWEIGNTVEPEQKVSKQEIFKGLDGIKLSFNSLDDTGSYDLKRWTEVQKNFELIVLLGKNINICNRLMHNKYGLYTTVPNRLPILVLHD